MPGVAAILELKPASDLAARLKGMLAAMRHHRWYVAEQHVDAEAGLALGRVSLGHVNTAPQPATNETKTLLAVMDGELYDVGEIRRELIAAGHHFSSDSHAELLVHGYQEAGEEFLGKLHGAFSAILWDADRRRLVLLNDRFGLRPLYYAKLPGRLLVASRIKPLMLDGAVSLEPNWRGITQFFSYGQYLCEDTSLADVHILPAGAHIIYDVDDDRLEIGTYYRLADQYRVSTGSETQLLDEVDAALARAVGRKLQDNDHLGLALSGGLDARLILALAHEEGASLQTVSYGIEGSLDHHCASQMARIVGCQHTNHMLDASFLADFRSHLDGMVQLTDGQYLSQCIVMPTLPVYRQLGIQVLLRGHAGELMHMHKAYAYSLDREALAIRDETDLESWLLGHLQGYMLGGLDGPLFRDIGQDEVAQLARESLRQCLAESAVIDPPVTRIWHLFVTQRLRRETALSLAKFGSVVETRVPYLDNDLVPLLLSLPPRMKLDETIQSHILRKRNPEFLNIVNSNTGTRIGAGRLARRLSTLRMRVLAKLGVRGYQPYERLGLWLRRELEPMVRDILLSEECLDHGIFAPDTIRTVINQHHSRQRNHTYLLMAMMIYELGRRNLAEHSCALSASALPEGTSRSK